MRIVRKGLRNNFSERSIKIQFTIFCQTVMHSTVRETETDFR